MKAICLSLVALCVQAGLAIPHGRFNALLRRSANSPSQDHHQHQHLHAARAQVTQTNTVVSVVTVTASNAVVWVDQYGTIISTDYHGGRPSASTTNPPPSQKSATPSLPVPSASSSTPVSISTPQPPVNQAAGDAMQFNPQQGTRPVSTTQLAPPASSAPPAAQQSSAAASNGAPSTSGENKFFSDMGGLGICYELIDNGSKCKSRATMDSEFGFLKSQGFTKVRVYDIGCPLDDVAGAASAQGLALIAGINTVSNVAGDIGKLISLFGGNLGAVDTIVVGNEVVNSNPGLVQAVVDGIGIARQLLSAVGYKGHVVTVDTFIAHSNHAQLCAASDYCAVNAHAFFDPNTVAIGAGDFVLNTAIGMVKAVANGKPIVITESGWPHAGSTNGQAVPSRQNQQDAIGSLKAKVFGSGYGLFLFQAYDALYKQPGGLGVEQFFGIYD
ncbi:hypothetical protein LTR84_007568 [Exophiala bonariae]|uniref:Uncharacterized protein n=1 Tax=Exophiala bonariae TaxID=1690606 RepID=A0AAV9NKW0_9EURO|nr:hypothetical protein LTR84_007568 [Exophiala bonariae]